MAALRMAPGWVVRLTRLPAGIPAVACMARRVVLINDRMRPNREALSAWLCGDNIRKNYR